MGEDGGLDRGASSDHAADVVFGLDVKGPEASTGDSESSSGGLDSLGE
jgi:hypothetical protein